MTDADLGWWLQGMYVSSAAPHLVARRKAAGGGPSAKFLCNKIWWTVVTLAAPEYLLVKAVGGWYSARLLNPDFQKFAAEDDVPWTKTHTQFADIGDFRIRFEDAAKGQEWQHYQERDQEQHTVLDGLNSKLEEHRKLMRSHRDTESRRYGEVDWCPHAVHCRQEGIGLAGSEKAQWRILSIDACDILAMLEGNVWTLSAAQLLEARKRQLISKLPTISEDEINDKRDSDILLKSLSLLQVTWMVAQMIARAVRHLPSTQLEVMTLAFAGCAFVIYLLLWERPRNVTTPAFLTADRFANASDMLAIAALHDKILFDQDQAIYSY